MNLKHLFFATLLAGQTNPLQSRFHTRILYSKQPRLCKGLDLMFLL